MEQVDIDRSVEEFLADARLVELCELQRTGDEVLDVISLSENQHSDILAWLLDAREGHGQGDEILRDLLVGASVAASGGNSGLDSRGVTAKFFSNWPPSRIRTTSFGAAFTARELGMSASDRVDLFVVDAQNEFVLLIENKAGAAHRADQLDLYREKFREAVAANPRLKSYAQAYIALDRNFDDEVDAVSRASATSWLHLGYEWLKASAARALMHVQRGNAAARLVVSYCNRQTDWEDPVDGKCIDLAAALHHAYPVATKHLIGLARGRPERSWLTSRSNVQSHLLFLLQNKSAMGLLKETQGMASVSAAILGRINALPSENVDHSRAALYVCPAGLEHLGVDGWWPIYVAVGFSDVAKTKYKIAVCWNAKRARSNVEAESLRQRLVTIDARFGKHSESRWRRVEMGRDVGLDELVKRLGELNSRLTGALID